MSHAQNETTTPWSKALGAGLIGSIVIGLVALAFLWPAKTAEPQQFPIAITGSSPQQVAAIKNGIAQNAGNKVTFVDAANRDDALQKIEKREVFGALVLSAPRPEALTASANGPAANGVMTTITTALQQKMSQAANGNTQKATVTVTDVVPMHNPKFDIALLALPLALGGIIGGVIISRVVRGRWQQLGTLAVYSLLAGVVLYGIVQSWFDVLPANFIAIAGAFSLGIFATASIVTGAYVQFGMRGLAVVAALTILLANPLSGMAIPSLFLPEPWGAIGQDLTVGAAGTLLRTAAYFPAADVLAPLMTLSIWSVVGVAAIVFKKQYR